MTFQPGQSGNPAGKPKQKPFRDALLVALNRDELEIVKGRTKLQAIAESLVNKAVAADVPAIKEIADRIDGKVAQAIVGDDEEAAIRIDGLALLLQAIDGKTRSV